MASELIVPHVWAGVEQSRCVVCDYTHDSYLVVMAHVVERHPEPLQTVVTATTTPIPATSLSFELSEDRIILAEKENE